MVEPLELTSYRPPPTAQFLSEAQVDRLRCQSNWRGVWLVLHAWGVMFGAVLMFVLFPNPITFILAWALIGARQLGLAILMHDAAHSALTKSRKLNFWLGQWFCAYPLFADTYAYRDYHLKHHGNVQQDKDPDLILSAPFPITRQSLKRKIIRDLTGQTCFKQRKAQVLNALGDPALPTHKRLALFWDKFRNYIIVQGALFSVFALAGYWHLYFLLWVLPFFTWNYLVTRIRNIAEHAMVPDDNNPFKNARTTKAVPLARAFIAPYWVNYHVEHHLLMWVPCYNLPKMEKFLIENNRAQHRETAGGYFEVLKFASSRPSDQDKPGKLIHPSRTKAVGISGGLDAA
jgi:fatty acid desaturase